MLLDMFNSLERFCTCLVWIVTLSDYWRICKEGVDRVLLELKRLYFLSDVCTRTHKERFGFVLLYDMFNSLERLCTCLVCIVSLSNYCLELKRCYFLSDACTCIQGTGCCRIIKDTRNILEWACTCLVCLVSLSDYWRISLHASSVKTIAPIKQAGVYRMPTCGQILSKI